MTDSSDPDAPSFTEISNRLGEPRERLLLIFDRKSEDGLDTGTLREEGDVPAGSIRHHLETLDEWRVIHEQDTRRYTPSGGSEARVWALTDRGQQFVDEYVDRQVPEADLEALSERVAELEAEVETLRNQHEEDIEDLRSRMKEAILSLKNQL